MRAYKNLTLKLIIAFVFNCIVLNTINAQLHADFIATPTSGCPPLVVGFSDNSTGNPANWRWELGNGTVSYLQNPVATYFNPGKYTVKLVVTNSIGKDSIVKSQYIEVFSLPQPKFSLSDSTGCYPLDVSFTDQSIAGSGNITNWQWDFGDGTLSNDQNPQHTYTASGQFTVILKVENSFGCKKVLTKNALIKTVNGVNASFSYTSVQGCSNSGPVTFSNTSTGTGALTYLWNFGDGGTSTAANPTHNFASGGSYTITLIVKNSFGCTDTLIKPNAINIGFVKAIMSAPDTVCVGKQFTVNNVSNPTTFVGTTWNFGDGTIARTKIAQKSYSTAGTYNIKLVTDFGSCSDSVVKRIVVLPKPTANFTANTTTACSGPLRVQFTNTSVGAVSYLWHFGDSITSTAANPVHIYNSAGSYTVTLFITNSSGCQDSITKTDFIIISPPKILKIDSLPVKGCIPYTIYPKVIMQDTVPISSYKWNFGDGTTSTAPTPSHTYTTAGAYDVTLIIETTPGCTDTLKVIEGVRVGSRPNINFTATPRDACASTTVTFTDLSTIAGGIINEWYWSFGDGGSSTDQNPTYNYNDTGYFNVTLIASNFGCSDTLKIERYMHILPPIPVFDTAFFCNDPMKRRFIDKSIGAQTWLWNFGDGSTSTLQNPSHVYADTGRYSVSLKVTNGACEYTKTTIVPIINENGVMTASDTTSCVLTRLTFRVNNVNRSNIQQYIWLPYGLGQDSTVNTIYAFAQYYFTPGSRVVYAVTTDILNCRDTLSVPANIRTYGPKANFSSSQTNICYGANIDFYDSSKTDNIHPIVEWKWNYGDGTIQSYPTGPFSHFYNNAGLYSVTLYVKDSYGCQDSMSKPALITITKPVARFTPSDTMLCPNTTVSFLNQSDGTNSDYTWHFGDGTISHEISPVYTYTQPGNYVVKLVVADRGGCADSLSITLRVFKAKASFSMSDTFSTCPPLIVNITNQSTNYVNFNWDFGDGGNSQLINPSHIYTYPGNYTVKLTVENNGGCVDSMIKNIVIQGPTGTFGYFPKTICNPGEIQYNLISNNTVKYVWDFDDGTTIFTTTNTASHIYTNPGLYLPKVILENVLGCRVPVLGLDTVKVIGIQTNILTDKRLFCDSATIMFRDSTTSNDIPSTIMWNFGDGDTSSVHNPVHTYSSPGAYTITLVATSEFGCKDTAIEPQFIEILPSPKVKITGNLSACEPGKVKFGGNLTNGDTTTLNWVWNFGNGQTSNIQNPDSQLYVSAGNYGVTVKVTNKAGCFGDDNKSVVIHPKPNVSAGADTGICKMTPHTLNATGASSYIWATDPSLSCTTCANPIATPAVTTTYYVTGKSAFGCLKTDTVTITVKQPFKLTVGNGDTICIGKTVSLRASGANSYVWTPSTWLDDPTSATPNSRPDSTITYKVVGSDNANCFKDSGTLKIKVYQYPKVSIVNGNVTNVIVGNSIQLNTTTSPDVISYQWSPSQWLSCTTCSNPVSKPQDNINYRVTVRNAGNCESSDDVSITLLCNDGNVFIPNTFSPNGDGANDVFYPRGKGLNRIKNFTIFNRWGQVVYQKSHISANDPTFGWDGMLNGIKAPTDVYVYLLDVICANNSVFPIKGNVTLVR